MEGNEIELKNTKNDSLYRKFKNRKAKLWLQNSEVVLSGKGHERASGVLEKMSFILIWVVVTTQALTCKNHGYLRSVHYKSDANNGGGRGGGSKSIAPCCLPIQCGRAWGRTASGTPQPANPGASLVLTQENGPET